MSSKKFFDNYYYNEVLFESPNFVVIPSLGSFIEGWLLFVPKKHYLSFGTIADNQLYNELNHLISMVGAIVHEKFGNYILFEHGPSMEKSLVGCGVDYAHIHLVPSSINLKIECEENNYLKLNWTPISDISEISIYASENLPYLFFETNDEKFIATATDIPSQLFRKILANKLGLQTMWDWKVNAYNDNIKNTITKIKAPNYALSL